VLFAPSSAEDGVLSGAGRQRVRDLDGVGVDLLNPCFGLFAPAGASVLQAIALAVHLEDMNVVGEPVEECAGQALGGIQCEGVPVGPRGDLC
jgi:hypothetical protein